MERRLNLYSPTPKLLTLNLPSKNGIAPYRYHAFVPRAALGGLRLEGEGLEAAGLQRVFVGALKPVIFLARPGMENKAWGRPVIGAIPLGGARLPLPAYITLERGGLVTGATVWIALVLGLFLILAAIELCVRTALWMRRNPPHARELAPFQWRWFFTFLLPLLLVWGFYLACFYPGGMSPDTIDQWDQLHTMKLHDAHPAFHTLTLKALTMVWDSPAMIAITQIVLLAACFAYAFTLLLRAGAPRWAVWIAYLAVLLSPRNGNLVIMLWKDVLYTIVVIAMTLMLAHTLLAPGRRRLGYWIGLGLVWGVIPLYRHNGLIILVGMLPVLPLFYWRAGRQVLLATLIALGLFFGVKKVLYSYLKVTFVRDTSTLTYNIVHIIPVLKQDLSISESDYDFLAAIYPLHNPWPFNPVMSIQIYYEPDYNINFVNTHAQELRLIDRSLLSRYPCLYGRIYMRYTSCLWLPPQPAQDRINCLSYGIAGNRYGLAMNPLLPRGSLWLQKIIGATTQPFITWLFWRPAIHLYLFFIALGLSLYRHRDPRFLVVSMPVFLNALSLFIAAASQDHRYQFPMTALSGFFLCLALIPLLAIRRTTERMSEFNDKHDLTTTGATVLKFIIIHLGSSCRRGTLRLLLLKPDSRVNQTREESPPPHRSDGTDRENRRRRNRVSASSRRGSGGWTESFARRRRPGDRGFPSIRRDSISGASGRSADKPGSESGHGSCK